MPKFEIEQYELVRGHTIPSIRSIRAIEQFDALDQSLTAFDRATCMGADLLLAGLPAAEITEDRKRQLHEIVNHLAELAGDELQHLADDPQSVREILHQHVEIFSHASRSREVTQMRLPHVPYVMLFTGGLSWGDDPTELFETFESLACIEPLFSQLEKWASQDAEAGPPDAAYRPATREDVSRKGMTLNLQPNGHSVRRLTCMTLFLRIKSQTAPLRLALWAQDHRLECVDLEAATAIPQEPL